MQKQNCKLHMGIDYRAANAIKVNDHNSLAHSEDVLNRMDSSWRFKKFDMAGADDEIRIATADREKTAFTSTFGLCEWWVLLIGLANAPSQSMQMINSILEPMDSKFIVIYIVKDIIHSHTPVDCIVHISEVLTSPTEHGLKAKHTKCTWACQKVDFCKCDIEKDGIHAQKHKTCVVLDWSQPENIQDVWVFLGLTSYYRVFIEHYAHNAMTLDAIGTSLERICHSAQ